MPTYEYQCKSCGQHLEVYQSFTDKPLKKHKECGGELKKVFHASGIVFKGSGFYATDSKAASSTKTGSNGSDQPQAEKKADKTSDKKAETKSTEKSGTKSSSKATAKAD